MLQKRSQGESWELNRAQQCAAVAEKAHLIPDWIDIWKAQEVIRIIFLYVGGETSAGVLCLGLGIPLRCRKIGGSPEENSKDSKFKNGLWENWFSFV